MLCSQFYLNILTGTTFLLKSRKTTINNKINKINNINNILIDKH